MRSAAGLVTTEGKAGSTVWGSGAHGETGIAGAVQGRGQPSTRTSAWRNLGPRALDLVAGHVLAVAPGRRWVQCAQAEGDFVRLGALQQAERATLVLEVLGWPGASAAGPL